MPAGASHTSKQLGNAIRQARETAGLTQASLAEKAGLKPNYVGEIERGEKVPRIDIVVRIAQGLGVTGEKLLSRARL